MTKQPTCLAKRFRHKELHHLSFVQEAAKKFG
jgi:hypothetical protein